MVNKFIEEINLALDNNLYLVALNTALTLPDICGKAEYPNLTPTARYKKWYSEHIGQYEINPINKARGINMPYLSGNIVYSLRCSLLHQGNPNIEGKHNINFSLVIEKKNEFDMYVDASSCGGNERSYSVSIRRLCCILCWTAEEYYKNNKNKFDFFNYRIVNIEDERKMIDEEYKQIDELLKGNK
jgi:hypothetical protein